MEEKNGKLSTIEAPEKDGNSGKKKSFWHIDRDMLPFKLHFSLFIGGMGAVLPYQSALGITKLGLTASNLAAAYTFQQFLFIFAKPGIGYLADYFNRVKGIIVGLTVLQAVFCFFMIIIPSANLNTPQNDAELDDYYKCHLCNHLEVFKNVSLNQPLEDGIQNQVFNCVEYSEKYKSMSVALHCASDSSLHLMNVSYQIMHTTCNNSREDALSSADYITSDSLYSGDVILIKQYFNNLQNSLIACLPPEGITFFLENFSPSHIKQYCYTVSKHASTDLQNLYLSSQTKPINCQGYESRVSSSVKYENAEDLSNKNFKSYQFWVFAFCLISSCTCITCIFTMSDTACYESVKGADYGHQRAWGAVSWGLIAPFAGFLNDYTDNYFASWCLMVGLCSLQIWNMTRMNLVKPDFSQSTFKDLKTVFSSFEFFAFEIGVLLNGAFTGVIWFYMTWFLTTIGGNKLIIGLAHTIQCFLGEVPTMFVSGWMIQKFGHFNLVSLAIFSHGVRFIIYSYLHNPWYVLPVEMLHGFTFGSFYPAMTSYGKLNSKPGTEATTQSVLCTTYEGLGAGLGCVISGICFDHYGGHTTFFYASFICAAATVINVVFSVLIGCRKGDLNVTKTATPYNERY